MKNLSRYLTGLVAGLVLAAALPALAAATYYYGWNPSTNLETLHGVDVDGSAGLNPVVVQSGQTISGQVGNANVGAWVATGTTTAAGTLTFPTAVPTMRICSFVDETTPADKVTQTTAVSTTVVTIAGTIVSGDTISYTCEAF
jgi:hypothetical protein